jgi:hypothetical protein
MALIYFDRVTRYEGPQLDIEVDGNYISKLEYVAIPSSVAGWQILHTQSYTSPYRSGKQC